MGDFHRTPEPTPLRHPSLLRFTRTGQHDDDRGHACGARGSVAPPGGARQQQKLGHAEEGRRQRKIWEQATFTQWGKYATSSPEEGNVRHQETLTTRGYRADRAHVTPGLEGFSARQ